MDRSSRQQDMLTILLYHGVSKTESVGIENYSGKHVRESVFLDQMKFIKKNCNILSIDDVVEISNEGKNYPHGSVVVSFDDGFRNNYTAAVPILDDLKIPAVFYIPSGMVGTNIMFWVDQLENCINSTEKKRVRIKLDEICEYEISTDEEKIDAIENIKKFCKQNDKLRKEILAELIDQCQVTPDSSYSKNYEKITWEELHEMNNNRLFTIGGHSLYHDILSELELSVMRQDVLLSIKLLEYNLQTPIKHYSYPEGQPNHYNENVINALKDNGIICCPSAVNGINGYKTDLFDLKRIMVGFLGTEFPFN